MKCWNFPKCSDFYSVKDDDCRFVLGNFKDFVFVFVAFTYRMETAQKIFLMTVNGRAAGQCHCKYFPIPCVFIYFICCYKSPNIIPIQIESLISMHTTCYCSIILIMIVWIRFFEWLQTIFSN